MIIYQNLIPSENRKTIEKSLKHDEYIACTNATVMVDDNGDFYGWVDNKYIACTNATVIVNDSGKFSGWINNDVPLCVITDD